MKYIDVYFSRLNHLGETTAERIRNSGIRSFEKWLNESPHTVSNLSVERGLYFKGIIQTNKDKEYEKIMFLYVSNDISLVVGDILNWQLDDGSIEKWLLLKEEKKVNGTYRSFWIIRCNYLIKWIDSQGHLQQSWSYVVSSLDSKIKGNFRTWHDLITPQPNKYAEIIMPRYSIARSTNFIIEEESWTLVEYDHTSVPGVVYLSLTENKINSIYDNVQEGIADTDKMANYSLSVPDTIQSFHIGEEIIPTFTLMKNGVPFEVSYKLSPEDKTFINKDLIAIQEGETNIIIQPDNIPTTLKLKIKISSDSQVLSGYIKGNNTIHLDREEEYSLIVNEDFIGDVQFSIDDLTKAIIMSSSGSNCIVLANNKNVLGSCILSAEYNNKVFTKEITIVPLW